MPKHGAIIFAQMQVHTPMPTSIKAAVCRQFGAPLTIETVTLAEPGPGELQIRMKVCGVCHSDITFAEGGWGGDLPMVLGHEAAGVVEAVGPGVEDYAPGDRVIATLVRACHACRYCDREQEFLCEAVFPLDETTPLRDAAGKPLTHAMRTGAFAEAIVVEKSQVSPLPADVSFEIGSLIACGVLTGYGAVTNTAKMQAGSHAVIVGCGGVGLNSVQAARNVGAATITAIDLDDEKLATAQTYGATHIVNPGRDDVAGAVHAATGGHWADYVFVTVGAGPVIERAADYLGRGGMVVIVGMPHADVMTAFNPASFAGWSQRIIGSKMGSAKIARDIPALLAGYLDGSLMLDDMISGRFRLDQINEAFASTKSGKALRNVIIFD
ncbi:MAG: Zn-dependent alcohol dehydrogenase [Pseudomonadota bacterium]